MNSALPTVSVITPTYNHAAFLGACLESVRRQTFAQWEQIVIDDGSTDANPEVVASHRDKRLRYEHQVDGVRRRLS